MIERKNFLLLAVGLGFIGIVIGSITIYNTVTELLQP